MGLRLFFFSLTVSAFCLFSCSPPAVTFVYNGQVVDQHSGKPVSGVPVEVITWGDVPVWGSGGIRAHYKCRTDKDGKFRLTIERDGGADYYELDVNFHDPDMAGIDSLQCNTGYGHLEEKLKADQFQYYKTLELAPR